MFFQDSASPVMEGIVNLHHDLMFFITFILFFVIVVLGRTLYYFNYDRLNNDVQSRSVVHGTLIEVV
jgi:cytochrome c oxidase subunit 2